MSVRRLSSAYLTHSPDTVVIHEITNVVVPFGGRTIPIARRFGGGESGRRESPSVQPGRSLT